MRFLSLDKCHSQVAEAMIQVEKNISTLANIGISDFSIGNLTTEEAGKATVDANEVVINPMLEINCLDEDWLLKKDHLERLVSSTEIAIGRELVANRAKKMTQLHVVPCDGSKHLRIGYVIYCHFIAGDEPKEMPSKWGKS